MEHLRKYEERSTKYEKNPNLEIKKPTRGMTCFGFVSYFVLRSSYFPTSYFPVAAGLALLLLAGCTRTEDYLEVFQEQRKAWNELADVLETIKDEKSMAAAKTDLEARLERYNQVVKKARDLPAPSEATKNRLEDERHLMERAVNRVLTEVGRIRRLPGGARFLEDTGAQILQPGVPGLLQPGSKS